MNQPPLNPDALEASAAAARIDWSGHTDWNGAPNSVQIEYRNLARAAVSAYLAAAQPEAHGAMWWIERANVNDWEDCEACLHHDDMCPVHYGINHVAEAVAQPVVNNVEELDQLPVGSVFMDSDKDWAYQIISNGEPGREGRVIVGAGLEEDFGADELTFPLTVLGRPEVKP